MNILFSFLYSTMINAVTMLFGATGEILTEKSGNLNLGIPGIMYIGGVSGLIGAFFYEQRTQTPNGVAGMCIAIFCALVMSMLAGLLYCFLTVTLRVNQNVVGLSLTTFGTGFGNFFGGSISRLAGGAGQVSVKTTGDLFRSTHLLMFVAVILAVAVTYFLKRTRKGLHLIAVGEDPSTADSVGIHVTAYKYAATTIGAMIAGLGGLYFVMEYLNGTWAQSAFGDRGWLAVALVILALWNPANAIWGSVLFGGLFVLDIYLPGLTRATKELVRMCPYLVTILVLIATSRRNKPENQPPGSLGLSYFREER